MLATPTPRASIDLHEVTVDLRKRGIQTPLLIRLPDILKHKLEELRDAFTTSIESNGYQGGYTCVYPIKVNQNRAVCEQIRDIATPLGFGLEVGSKPELLATLGITTQHLQMPIICNGFKDDRFLETALLATKLGHNITPVVERLSELKVLIRLIQQYKTPAKIGLRYKLSAAGGGRWKSSAGPRSKFGCGRGLTSCRTMGNGECLTDCVHLIEF